jgi:nitrile hydratase subunit beta
MSEDVYVSHADLGGSIGHGAGSVEPEPESIVFHHEWQRRVLGLNLAAGGLGTWNIDMSRRVRETLPDYADLSYYEIWLASLERSLVERGLVSHDEVAAGHAIDEPVSPASILTADRVASVLAAGRSTEREPVGPARFAVGDQVRTRPGRVDHHTRLPGYAAGKVGVVERVHGAHVFPDTNAHGRGEQPQWLYTVVFDAVDLWPDAPASQRVSVDAWETYLSPARTESAA